MVWLPWCRCQQGAEEIQSQLDELWPEGSEEPDQALKDVPICPGSSFQDWRSCKGSQPDSRGYTCGLWQLLHSLASHAPDTDNTGARWLTAVSGFVEHYFQCNECAKHFVNHANDAAGNVVSKRDAVLWLWRTHNKVWLLTCVVALSCRCCHAADTATTPPRLGRGGATPPGRLTAAPTGVCR